METEGTIHFPCEYSRKSFLLSLLASLPMQGSADGGVTAAALLPLAHPKTGSRTSSRKGCREWLWLFSSARSRQKNSAKAHDARMAALATVGDTAETLPNSLKPAMGHSADRKATMNTAFTAKIPRERSGL